MLRKGKPGVLKDGYILEHHLEQLVLGAKWLLTLFPLNP